VNDRLSTLFGALLALLIATGLLFSHAPMQADSQSRPTSRDTGDNGLAGAARWLAQSGIAVQSLHERYTELPTLSPTRSGNLLIVSEPMVHDLHSRERHTLETWLRRGNDVLLLEAFASRPEWARQASVGSMLQQFDIVSRLAGKKDAADVICADQRPATDVARPGATAVLRPHPDDVDAPPVIGVREVRVLPEDGGSLPGQWILDYRTNSDHISFEWLCDTARGRAALWQFRVGRGRVWVSSYPQLFANRNLGVAGNARLLANIVGISVATGGAVIFDDMHQGDSALYDPAALFRDRRLHASLALLFTIWLLYLLGYSNRYMPPSRPMTGITPAQFVESVGTFLARELGAAASADALLQRLQRDLRRHNRQAPDNASVWELIASRHSVDPKLVTSLRKENMRLREYRNRDLRPFLRCLQQIRKQLQ